MSDLDAEQRASAELAEVVFRDPAARARFELMVRQAAASEPVPDDPEWIAQGGGDRVSLHPLAPEDALRALLATPPSDGSRRRHA